MGKFLAPDAYLPAAATAELKVTSARARRRLPANVMNTLFDSATPERTVDKLCLLRGEVVSDDEARGSITCLRGRLWITQTGLNRDVLLGAGQTFQPCRTGLLVIEALEPACVERHSTGINRPFANPIDDAANNTTEDKHIP